MESSPAPTAIADVIKRLPLDNLFRLALLGTQRSFRTGAVLMRQGEPSTSLHLIMSGRVRVERRDAEMRAALTLAEIGPGEVVGELGVLDGKPRTATVVAIEETQTVEIAATALALTALQYPATSQSLLRSLGSRLRSTDQLAERLLHAESALRESERRFRAVFDDSAIGMVLLDLEARPMDMNASFEQMLGYTRDDITTSLLSTVMPEEDAARHQRLLAGLLNGRREHYELETRVIRQDGRLLWAYVTVSLVRAATGEPRFAVAMVQDITERIEQRHRREALLTVARSLALEADSRQIQATLLEQAAAVVGADGGAIYEWSEAHRTLMVVRTTLTTLREGDVIPGGQGGLSQAVETLAPVVIKDYAQSPQAIPSMIAAGVQEAIALPLVHERRVHGILDLGLCRPDRSFSEEDVEVLEVLAGIGSAALAGVERSRMQGVLLAARTVEHELNNQLARTVGYSELLANDPRLPEELRSYAEEAFEGARLAAETINRFRRIKHVAERHWGDPSESTIDLDRST